MIHCYGVFFKWTQDIRIQKLRKKASIHILLREKKVTVSITKKNTSPSGWKKLPQGLGQVALYGIWAMEEFLPGQFFSMVRFPEKLITWEPYKNHEANKWGNKQSRSWTWSIVLFVWMSFWKEGLLPLSLENSPDVHIRSQDLMILWMQSSQMKGT